MEADRLCWATCKIGTLRNSLKRAVAIRVFLFSPLSLCPDSDSETLKAAKVWKLAEVLVGDRQQCQDAKSQQKEQMVLLEKKSATYSQVCQSSGIAFSPLP